jgi:GNAT superfamily N-acetyltransferase
MWQNLYQKTIYEVYKSKEFLGYKIFEFEKMFVILWNNQQMFYFNMAHTNKFGKDELVSIQKNIPDTFLCVASSCAIDDETLPLKKGTPSYLMVLNVQSKVEENTQFKILRVSNQKTAADFCDVISDVYDKKKDRELLVDYFTKEIGLENCFRYVGYIDNEPAGAVEFSEGKEAACVSWGAVKKEFRKRGLYKAMFAHAINNEINRGINTIVLNSSEMGRDIYIKMGFTPLANRYNYVLEK